MLRDIAQTIALLKYSSIWVSIVFAFKSSSLATPDLQPFTSSQ